MPIRRKTGRIVKRTKKLKLTIKKSNMLKKKSNKLLAFLSQFICIKFYKNHKRCDKVF